MILGKASPEDVNLQQKIRSFKTDSLRGGRWSRTTFYYS